jgi:hypothetical protein
MSDDLEKPERASGIGFELEDMDPKAIFAFLISLALAGILIHFALKGLYGYLDAYFNHHQPTPNPLVKAGTETRTIPADVIAKFPQPRLETNERLEIKDFRLQEEKILDTYGWVDQQAGVVRIPIDRAMQLLAQQGLPTQPQTGTAPPSTVNMAREAAKGSDTRQAVQPKGKQKR